MTDYISRDLAIETIRKAVIYEAIADLVECAINSIPAADVAPVKPGKWLRTPTWWVYCSVCGQEPPNETYCMTNYCPNCGAMMEES